MALRLELRLFFRPISGEIAIIPSGPNVNISGTQGSFRPQVFFIFLLRETKKLMSFCVFFWLFRVYLGLRVLKFILYAMFLGFVVLNVLFLFSNPAS